MRAFGRRPVVCILACAVAAASCSSDSPAAPRPPAGQEVFGQEVFGEEVFGQEVFSVRREPQAPLLDAPTVLFLHGASFTSDTWVDTGVLDRVAMAGFEVLAVDLPGHGRTEATVVGSAEFLAGLIDQVDAGSGVVVVAPSMAGAYALPLLSAEGATSMRGFVPIAPVGIPDFLEGPPIEGLPTLIVWGEDDDVIAPSMADGLAAAISPSSVALMPDAGHAAYRNDPDLFAALLVEFLRTL